MTTKFLTAKYGVFITPAHDHVVTGCLEQYGEYSEPEVDLFRQIIPPGSIVVEGGANIGALSVPLSRMLGPTGKLLAFEPQPALYKMLIANIAMNGLQAELHNKALGDTITIVSIPDFADYNMDYNYGRVEVNSLPEFPSFAIPQVTLDSLDLPACRFIKLDIEGMEEAALRGGKDFIAKHKPLMFIENDRKPHVEALTKAIRDLGYTPYWHITHIFNPDNFKDNQANTFGTLASFNMLCVPDSGPNILTVNNFTEVNDESMKIIKPCLSD